MSGQIYVTDSARQGELKAEILKRCMPQEILGLVGQQRDVPKNTGGSIYYKRWLPYGGVDNRWISDGGDEAFVSAHLTAEGVTPQADSISSTPITATLKEYAALYSYNNHVAELHPDDIPEEEKNQAADRIMLVREMVRYGELKSGSTVYYSGTAQSRAAVNDHATPNLLRLVKRGLENLHAKNVTEILAPSPNIGTSSVEASYLVFCHSDCESDLRDMTGFVTVANYGSRKPIHEREIGTWESFRFITSPELTYYPGAGSATLNGMKATGSNVDVYPMIITGMNAWGQAALRGLNSIQPSHVPINAQSKADPLNQRGYIGIRTYFDCTILNDGWMARLEVGVTDLAV